MTRMKLVLKGIDTAEDAKLARENGADGVVVSNHGGRATETGRAPVASGPNAAAGTITAGKWTLRWIAP
jgi:4-hydroxymandelate oxidase